MRIKIREAVAFDSPPRVDRERCVIHGVRVIGATSRNGRKYTPGALDSAVPLYENARVYVDHPTGDDNARRVRERFGRLKNVARDPKGAVGDLHYNPKHADAESILWYAENDPGEIGLSHNAEGNGRRLDDGTILVEKVTKVHSVDVVDGPATTLSLYEQFEGDPMDPLTDPAATPDAAAPPAGGGSGGNIESMLADLAKEITAHPEWDKATKIAKLKAVINMLEDGAADDAAPVDEPKSDDEMMEQLGRFKSGAVRRARKTLLRERHKAEAARRGVPAAAVTDVFLEQLAAARPADVIRLIEDRRAVAAKPPASHAPAPTGGGSPDLKKIAADLFGD